MIDNPILKRREDETVDDFHIRIYSNMYEYGLDKFKAAEIVNEANGTSYDESKWRKDYAQFMKWHSYLINKNLDKDIAKKHEELRIESEKAKIRQRDQKREYNKLITNQARFEEIKDDVYDAVLKLEKKKPLTFSPKFDVTSGKHGLALFSDWHYGMNISNSTNTFNIHVFNKRVEKLVNKIIEYGHINQIETLHIGQLGDLISGSIHVSTRVQSNEDVIEQTKYVSEVLSEILSTLANEFPRIKYYNVIGNHGRTGNKHDVGIKENFEYLVPWFLEARLREFDNIEIITDQDGYITTKILNEDVVLVHGNYDRVEQCVTRLPQLLGYVPSYIMGGHVHHNYEKEYGKTTVVVNGSLIGADDYAMQGRYGAKPSQKFMIFDEDGLESTYIIKLAN
jgi:hypothetical protein